MNEYQIEQIHVGMECSFKKTITLEMENAFRTISGDENPLHKDDSFAVNIGKGSFKGHVSFGMLTAALYSTIVGMYLPGKYSLIHSFDELSFLHPVYVGDELEIMAKVTEVFIDLNLVIMQVLVKNQSCKVVSRAKIKVLVLKKFER